MRTMKTEQPESTSFAHYCFYFLLCYLPYQSYLPDTSFGPGINLLNLLIIILLLATLGKSQPFEYAGYSRFNTLILLFMGYTLLMTLFHRGFGSPLELFILWKRMYFIPILFFLTYSLLDSTHQIRRALAIMSFVTLTSAVQVLRNNLEYSGGHYNDGLRYGGMFGAGGENDLAAFLAINFFLFLFWFQEAPEKWKKAAIAGMGALVGLACLYCYSRGAYIALTCGLILYSLRKFRALLLVLVLLLMTASFWAPRPVYERIEMLTQSEKVDNDASAQTRLRIWDGAKLMFADNMLVGVGPGNFEYLIRKYADLPENSPTSSHNMYLRMATELGLVGLVFFLLFLGIQFKEGLKLTSESSGWPSRWGAAFSASILAVFIVNCFGDRFLREELTGYIWISAALTYRLRGMLNNLPKDSNSAGSQRQESRLKDFSY